MTGLEPAPNFLKLVNWELLCGYSENPRCCSGGRHRTNPAIRCDTLKATSAYRAAGLYKTYCYWLVSEVLRAFFFPQSWKEAAWRSIMNDIPALRNRGARGLEISVFSSGTAAALEHVLCAAENTRTSGKISSSGVFFSKPKCLEVSWVLEKQNESKTKWITFYVMSTNWVQRTTWQASRYAIKWQHFMPLHQHHLHRVLASIRNTKNKCYPYCMCVHRAKTENTFCIDLCLCHRLETEKDIWYIRFQLYKHSYCSVPPLGQLGQGRGNSEQPRSWSGLSVHLK